MDEFGVVSQQLDARSFVWRLRVQGELDAATVARLEDVIEMVLNQGARLVMLDLADVSFVDSTGMRSVLLATRRLEADGGRLVCEGLSAAARRVFELTGTIDALRRPSDDDQTFFDSVG